MSKNKINKFLNFCGQNCNQTFLVNKDKISYTVVNSEKLPNGNMKSSVEYHLIDGNYIISTCEWEDSDWKQTKFKDDFNGFIVDQVNKMLNN